MPGSLSVVIIFSSPLQEQRRLCSTVYSPKYWVSLCLLLGISKVSMYGTPSIYNQRSIKVGVTSNNLSFLRDVYLIVVYAERHIRIPL